MLALIHLFSEFS